MALTRPRLAREIRRRAVFFKRNLFFGLLLAAVSSLPGCAAKDSGQTITGRQTGSFPAERETGSLPEEGIPLSHCESVTQTNGEITFSLDIPEGWLCEAMLPGGLEAASFGFHLFPEDAAGGFVEVGWAESFGTDGTGLKEEEISLAGDSALVGTFSGSECWSFISFQGKNSGIIAVASEAEGWLPEQAEELLSILDSLRLVRETPEPF